MDAANCAIELDPSFPTAYLAAGWVYQHDGRHDQAITAIGRCAELTDRCPFAMAALGCALAEVGRTGEARAVLVELEARGADAWHLGQLYWKLGQEEHAFDLFERAVRERNPGFFVLARAPALERLIRDPRWSALLRRAGLGRVASVFEAQRQKAPSP
jgi:tetratricopeptide (TPR) repeat protein